MKVIPLILPLSWPLRYASGRAFVGFESIKKGRPFDLPLKSKKPNSLKRL